ncbi:PEP-CTERM sorting domain-containing protein [Cerasicoccus arenae]|uniref:Ice-binding protein C-terminal domain-containing protein n=1 Tax=Cerasicoccus arenae TaxID=424488 RepID=A0A8J3D926_9BACT|nr:PEP-CTERM sorting domain-containing protein [Cerasicoccus arenae]MBK1857735.1 PEP-CTERM sorting domain-containing protein [Cerasicoccus arenae]GHB91110.1 hypothetical protein GCM10007047_02550 [Cerasicoccus arenae]
MIKLQPFRLVIGALFISFCSSLPASTIVTYKLADNGNGIVAPSFSSVVSAGEYDPRTSALGTDGSGSTISGFSTQSTNTYMRATGTTVSSLPSSGTNAYHTFAISIAGLAVDEVLDLTSVSFRYYATGSTSSTTFTMSFFSDAVGFADPDRLGTQTLSGSTLDTAQVIDLTSSNSVAGTAFTGLTNGTDIEFSIYFGDTGSNANNTNAINRIGQDLVISGDVRVVPEPSTYAMIMAGLMAGSVLLRRRLS